MGTIANVLGILYFSNFTISPGITSRKILAQTEGNEHDSEETTQPEREKHRSIITANSQTGKMLTINVFEIFDWSKGSVYWHYGNLYLIDHLMAQFVHFITYQVHQGIRVCYRKDPEWRRYIRHTELPKSKKVESKTLTKIN